MMGTLFVHIVLFELLWSEVWHAEYTRDERMKSRIASMACCLVHYLYDRVHGGNRDYCR